MGEYLWKNERSGALSTAAHQRTAVGLQQRLDTLGVESGAAKGKQDGRLAHRRSDSDTLRHWKWFRHAP